MSAATDRVIRALRPNWGIRVELLYFVPLPSKADPSLPGGGDSPCELWVLRLRNVSSRRRNIRTFSYVEFSQWNADADLNNLDWGQHVLHSRVEEGLLPPAPSSAKRKPSSPAACHRSVSIPTGRFSSETTATCPTQSWSRTVNRPTHKRHGAIMSAFCAMISSWSPAR